MREARDNYYKFLDDLKEIHPDGLRDEITDYIAELEAEKEELIEFVKMLDEFFISQLDSEEIIMIINKRDELLKKHGVEI